jgi:hypothetical protein
VRRSLTSGSANVMGMDRRVTNRIPFGHWSTPTHGRDGLATHPARTHLVAAIRSLPDVMAVLGSILLICRLQRT